MRVGAIDCGTNSLRLLIADVVNDEVHDVIRRHEVVRLGEGVDTSGELAPAALTRTLAMCREYAQLCADHDVVAVRFVATSATRDASNAEEFSQGVRQAFQPMDVAPEVISGTMEADLSFFGATNGLSVLDVPTPYLVVDIGGGSTEFALGTTAVTQSHSVDIGAVRLTERHRGGGGGLADADALRAAAHEIDAALKEVARVVPITDAAALVGVAGTITTVTAHALRLTSYRPRDIHRARLPTGVVEQAAGELTLLSREQLAALPYLHPGRIDVIAAGALIWQRIVQWVAEQSGVTEVITSEHDILDGIAVTLASRLS